MDYKAGNQTLYVLALKRGVKLRTIHRTLRAASMTALFLPLVSLYLVGLDWKGLVLVSLVAGLLLFWALGAPPPKADGAVFSNCYNGVCVLTCGFN